MSLHVGRLYISFCEKKVRQYSVARGKRGDDRVFLRYPLAAVAICFAEDATGVLILEIRGYIPGARCDE